MNNWRIFLMLALISNFLGAQNQAQIDPNFNVNGGFGFPSGENGSIHSVKLLDDGHMYVAGNFEFYNFVESLDLVKLTPEGNLDPNFDIGTGFNSSISEILLLEEGKLLVIGGFTQYNGTAVNSIVILNEDGSIDQSFDSGSGIQSTNGGTFGVNCVVRQDDGKFIVGGNFNKYNGMFVKKLIRINSDGSLDTSFEVDGFDGHPIDGLAIQEDGKILVGGRFNYFFTGGGVVRGLIRLLPNGSPDTTFDIGEGFVSSTSTMDIRSINIREENKIILAGSFTGLNGTDAKAMIRLYEDGSIDESFHTFTSPNNHTIWDVKFQNDGKMLLAGYFEYYNGVPANNFIRLYPDGNVDSSFSIGTGFNGGTFCIEVQEDGKIIVGGRYSLYNGNNSKSITRLLGTSILSTEDFINEKFKAYPIPVTDYLNFSHPIQQATIFDIYGKIVRQLSDRFTELNLSGLSQGAYFLQASLDNNRIVTIKFTKV